MSDSNDARDAARFRYLQNAMPLEAQAFFWLYESRKQREKAIDEAIEESKRDPKILGVSVSI